MFKTFNVFTHSLMYTADKITDLNQDKASILKPKPPPVTAKPSKPKTTSAPAVTGLSS